MKLAVLANEKTMAEWKLKPMPEGMVVLFAKDVDELVATTANAYFDLLFENDSTRLTKLAGLQMPVFINAVTNTLQQMQLASHTNIIRINAWPGFLNRSLAEIAAANETAKQHAANVLQHLKWQYTFVPDKVGMVSPRIVCMIINEAYLALQEGVSTKNDIDIAMQQGTNYPYGPFEWAQKIGLKNVCSLLLAMAADNKKYQPAFLLIKEAEQ